MKYYSEDVTGNRFTRLIALENKGLDRNLKWCWTFRCDCGKVFEAVLQNVKNGKTKSCGCLNDELRRARGKGHKQHPLYSTWKRMRQRCNDPNVSDYKYYGGRGITVCERWNDFDLFAADMGPKPSPEYTIERKDNNGNYEPLNCKWATRLEQTHNRG